VGLKRDETSSSSSVEASPVFRVGIDENGLGARLGPLVVTAVVAEVTRAGLRAIESGQSQSNQPLLGDSKRLIAHGDVRLGEAWARVLAGGDARHPAELLEAITAVPTAKLKQRCPSNAKAQCWHDKKERFKAGDFLLTDVERARLRLQKRGIKPVRVLSRLVCTSELNTRGEAGENRFLVDLHCMEELILQISGNLKAPLKVVCGKVGSMRDYTRHFAHLNGKEPEALLESPASSVYRLASLGEVRFVRDADATDPLVMLASLVGKYLRELFVDRIGRHFASELTQLSKPSGYHDPVTAEFAEATADLRSRSGFPQSCFERAARRDT
jgi:ribonuclease HII